MKNYCVYILYSKKLNKFYVGETEDLNDRFIKHQTKFYKSSFTSQVDDWVLFHMIECESKSQAIKIEKHIKNMKSTTYIQNLKKYTDIEKHLLEKYS